MQDNNVVIISNNKLVAEQLAAKIVLLRSIDAIAIFDYENALKSLQEKTPDLILIYSPSNESPDIIKQVKFKQSLKNVPIIFVTDSINQESLFNAFDDGISDFLTLNLNEAQILMKIMWGLQKSQLLKELENKSEILEALGIIDKESGFYKTLFTEKVFKINFENIIKNKQSAIFMALSSDINCKNVLPQSFLASVLKKTLRKGDIIGFGADNKFYIILNKTDKNGVSKAYEKIKNNLGETYSISAAAIQIKEHSFEAIERLVNKSLTNAIIKGSSLIFIDEKSENKAFGWLDKSDLKETNFKMFQQIFMKKFNKIVTPIFFQMQTVLQEKLFETKIEQYVNDSESMFSLEKPPFKSYIKIKYPGHTKINIDVVHSSLKEKTNERITFDINELTQSKLEEVLQKLVITFQENIK